MPKRTKFKYPYPENVIRYAIDKYNEKDIDINDNNREEYNKIIFSIIEELQPKEKVIIQEYFSTDKSFAEISSEIGISTNRVNQLYHHGVIRVLLKMHVYMKYNKPKSEIILDDNVTLSELCGLDIISNRLYYALIKYYNHFIKSYYNLKEIHKENDPNPVADLAFIKYIFNNNDFDGKPIVCSINHIGKNGILEMAKLIGYNGGNKYIDELIDSDLIARNKIDANMNELELSISKLYCADDDYINHCLDKLDKLKNLLDHKRGDNKE